MSGKTKKQSGDFNLGLEGDCNSIAQRAAAGVAYSTKLDLLEGCVQAFTQGRAQNLQHFFKAYIAYKLNTGRTNPDDGYEALLVKPFNALTADPATRQETAKLLLAKVAPHHMQATLDIILRRACFAGFENAAEAGLLLGANPNAASRPVLNAVQNGHERLLPLLYRFGADFAAAARKSESYEESYNILLHKADADDKTIATLRQQAAEMTARIKLLEQEPEAPSLEKASPPLRGMTKNRFIL